MQDLQEPWVSFVAPCSKQDFEEVLVQAPIENAICSSDSLLTSDEENSPLNLTMQAVTDDLLRVEAHFIGKPTKIRLMRARVTLRWLLLQIVKMTPVWLAESYNPRAFMDSAWQTFESGQTQYAYDLHQRFIASLYEVVQGSDDFYSLICSWLPAKDSAYRSLSTPVSLDDVQTVRARFGAIMAHLGDEEAAATLWKLQGDHDLSLFFLAELQRRRGNFEAALGNYRRSAVLGSRKAELFAQTLERRNLRPSTDTRVHEQGLSPSETESLFHEIDLMRRVWPDPFYIETQMLLLESLGRLTEVQDLQHELREQMEDPVAVFLSRLEGPSRVHQLSAIVESANRGNFFAIDALITDASRRDSIMEVDHWTHVKQFAETDPATGSVPEPSSSNVAALADKLGRNMGLGVVALIGAVNLARIQVREVSASLRNIDESLDGLVNNEQSSLTTETADATDSDMEFMDFEGF